ncbi:MAG: UDP-glucose 6-dehydrogenase [Chloroflexi bacterium]|nr:MAG: UDP-glucose 6-dehydrogenase [Chloroflexota bacterium]
MARISVIGSGYVGLVYCAAFAELGHDVWGVDIDADKVRRLNAGECPIYEPGLPELLTRNLATGRLHFTTDYAAAVPKSEFVFLCVDTPASASGEADLRTVRKASASIGRHLAGDTVVVNKSTMPIGAGDLVESIIARVAPAGATFSVVSNAEFLREGSAVHDVLHPERVVIGCDDHVPAERVAKLFAPLGAPLVITDRRTAEMIKYASNAFLATKISFINEIAQVCERVGADVTTVARGMGLDPRIGSQFLEAGIGYGGSCFPKDVKALAFMAREAGYHPSILNSVMDVNADQRRRFVAKVQQRLGDLEGKTIAVWGLSFKQDTDDMRESPAIDIIRTIEQRGGRVVAFDPAAREHARTLLPNTTIADDLYSAVAGADALCIVTPWSVFRTADFNRVRDLMQTPLIVDGRNLLDPALLVEHGFEYIGVGRRLRRLTPLKPLAQRIPVRVARQAVAGSA